MALAEHFGGPLLRPDTDLSSVNFYIFLSNLGLHESTVGVALGSHIAERKRVRAHGVRKSVFYSTRHSQPPPYIKPAKPASRPARERERN